MKNNKSKEPIVLIDEQHTIPKKTGNGILRYFMTTDSNGCLLRYSLAYINSNITMVDNGRVIGYDNDHNYHHRHCMGAVEPINFISYQELLNQFEQEWRTFHGEYKQRND